MKQDEGSSPRRFALSFVVAGIVLVLMVVVVSRPSHSTPDEQAQLRPVDAMPTSIPTSFTLPPLPQSEVMTYYLVDSEAEAASVRAKANADEETRQAAGQPEGARVVALVAEDPDAEVVYRAELMSMAQRSLQAGYGVRYDIVDLRRH